MIAKRRIGIHSNKVLWVFCGACMAALALYAGLLSRHYDLNGIIEVRKVELGEATPSFFTPNHLLYSSVGLTFYRFLQALGYERRALDALQILTAIFGALGMGTFFLVIQKFTKHLWVSFLVCVTFAFSYGYWVHSTEVYYATIATFFMILTLLLFLMARDEDLRQQLRWSYSALLGVAFGLSILFYQGNVLFFPALATGLLVNKKPSGLRIRINVVLVFSLILVIAVGLPYVVVGMLIFDVRTPLDLFQWVTSYRGDNQYSPMYGVSDVGRAWNSLLAIIGIVVPVREGLGARKLLNGQLSPDKILSQLSLLLTMLVALGSAAYVIRHRRSFGERYGWLFVFAVVGFVPFFLFNTWWDPDEIWAWFTPVLPLWLLWAAVIVEAKQRLPLVRVRYGWGALCLYSVVLAGSALQSAIIPRHFSPNVAMEKALFAARQMHQDDLMVTTTWNWVGYLPYFADQDILDLTAVYAQVGDPAEVLRQLDHSVAHSSEGQRRVFLVDIFSHNDDEWSWITQNTGLTLEDFARYDLELAWSYLGTRVWEIKSVSISSE